jgi:cobalamin biosynthesis Mg chelatase CobN
MLKINEKGNNINLSKDQKNKGLRLTQRKVESKDLGNISMDLSKEEEIMKKTPGLMENSMIENITAMNSIFEQKQSERLMLNNLNKLNKINDSNNDINNSNQTLTNLVGNTTSNSNNNENPLDVARIIKDSQEVIDEEKKKEKEKRKKGKGKGKKRNRKKKKKKYNISIILIVILMVIILILIIGLVKTYLSLSN